MKSSLINYLYFVQ